MRHSRLALCCLFAATSLEAAPPPWLEVKSPHFTVLTNDGERQGRRIAWQFEQIRAGLVKIWPWAKIDSGRPFLIFAASDEATLKTLGPQYWEGKRFRPSSFGASGRDRQFVALRTDVQEPDEVGTNPYQTAYWSYVGAVFNRSFPQRLPQWYSRGIAEVMSNTIVREKEMHVGRPMRGNLELMTQRPAIPFDEFLAADHRSHWLTQDADIARFDAQAWALVHLLMFGDKGAHAARMDRFGTLLMNGAAHDVALKEAFGDMDPYFDKMRQYVLRALFGYAKVPLSAETRRESYASRPLPSAEAATLRGQFLIAMRRPAEARAAAAEAAKADPAHPGPAEIEAELLEVEGKRDLAKAEFLRAAEAGSRRAHVHYRLAQLEWTANLDKAALERLATRLETAKALEPDSANTLAFLAGVRVDLGQKEEALPLAQRAVEIEPAESYHRMTLARALWSLQRTDEAEQAAQSALRTARTEDERRRAQDYLEFVARARTRAAPQPASPSAPAAASAVRIPNNPTPPVAACFGLRDDLACGVAAPLLEAECEKGQPEACRSLGSLYDGGFGVKQDRARAAAAYAKGCGAGNRGSCARLAVLQVHGEGVARDPATGLATLERLCGEGIEDGCIGWATVLIATRGKPEVAKARELLEATCGQGNQEACRLLKSLR